MITTGIKSGVRKYLLFMSMFMFLVSTGYWILKVYDFVRLVSFNLIRGLPQSTGAGPSGDALLIFGAFILVNYALTDAVVLWRAWVLCSPDYRKLLYVPLFFLCCATTTIFATIVIRITTQSIPNMEGNAADPRIKALTRATDVCQVANLVFSLLLNLTSTALIAVKAWRFRRWIKFDLGNLKSRRTRGEKIMALLVESGSLYCLSGITALVSTVVRLPVGTVGDLYTPVNTQIAGMYPIVVLLLVNHGNTLENTVFIKSVSGAAAPSVVNPPLRSAGVIGSQESIRFRSGRSQSFVSETYSRNVISTQISEAMRSPVQDQISPKGDEGASGDTGFGPVKSDIKYTLKYMDAIRE
ncbi:hypothetical protein V5O48_016713 [Marasmius crinis-equi]|uniref:Uncharacterized protein n=1 Tax=Marasmius crinis-equi TaxID=585013 RepID=A0ABR3ER12_9AGAR